MEWDEIDVIITVKLSYCELVVFIRTIITDSFLFSYIKNRNRWGILKYSRVGIAALNLALTPSRCSHCNKETFRTRSMFYACSTHCEQHLALACTSQLYSLRFLEAVLTVKEACSCRFHH